MNSKAFLIILDGWGIGPVPKADAIAQADTPFMDGLMKKYPWSTLITHGEDVGLPVGQMGNSEVGHMNIGAGRIVWQDLARIDKSVREQELDQNKVLAQAVEYALSHHKAIHLLGLVSDGGVHSHIEHLKALVSIIESRGASECYIHAFTDGRDCDPKSGEGFLTDLQTFLKGKKTRIASLIGRYYAMDRDKRWERVKRAYDLLVHGKAASETSDFAEALRRSYAAGITDEFAEPVVSAERAVIREGDCVICFNFRTDRLREITSVLTQQNMPDFDMHTLPLHYVTMTRYDDKFQKVEVLYDKADVGMTLGEVVEKAGKTQLRAAETEKYPHVTFFFSGGREEPFSGETRILVPSPKVATYDLQPEMSAPELAEAVLKDLRNQGPDFICLNFANTDMVGHTGVFSAAMKAAETVDGCLARLVPAALEEGYHCLVIADHGNSDYMINEDGSPNTAHTKNPVPCVFVGAQAEGKALKNGKLADVAPTLLAVMGIPQPAEMTGTNLIYAVD